MGTLATVAIVLRADCAIDRAREQVEYFCSIGVWDRSNVLGGERSLEEPRGGGAPSKPGERLVLAAQEIAAMGGDDVEESLLALSVAKGLQRFNRVVVSRIAHIGRSAIAALGSRTDGEPVDAADRILVVQRLSWALASAICV